jgi:DNA helicase-2/ATP-dependent DNA helicase PcrA
VENLDELLGSMQEFEGDAEEPTLAAFLELVTLQTDADRSNGDHMLTLMTVHAAKGLEFSSVFVAGLEEELFPRRGFEFDDDPDELEEERRLAYVAFTRAERTLVVTHAHTRRVHGELKMRRRSRFIDEMPQTDVRVLGKAVARTPTRSWQQDPYATVARPRSHAAEFVAPTHTGSYVDRSDSQEAPDGQLRPGMQVLHRTYGVGKVQTVDQSSPPKVSVSFPGWGRKTILASFLEPT